MSIVNERASTYGPVKRGGNLTRVARLWSGYLGTEVTEHDVAWLMVLMKASRSREDPRHLDNYVDAKGYVDIAELLR